jgi:hypothetical protein
VRDPNLEVCGLGHDRRIRAPRRHERIRADASELFVDHRRDDQPSCGESAIARDAHRVDHRGDAPLHILRPAPVNPAVPLRGIERRRHAGHSNCVDVTAEHQRRSGLRSFQHANYIRPAWRGVLFLDVQPEAPQVRFDKVGDGSFAGGARHERRVDGIDRDEIAEQRDDRVGAG